MKYLPNILTMLRIIMVPFFIYFFSKENMMLAFILFITASLTDYLDGFLARKYQVISNFGKIMDPLADKLLVLSALGVLTFGKFAYLSVWIFVIIISREIIITILREIYKKRKIFLPANIWGKLKTVTQMIGLTLVLLMLSLNLNIQSYSLYINIYFWLVALITILSGMSYLTKVKELF